MNNNYLDSLEIETYELRNNVTVVHGKVLIKKTLPKEQVEKLLDENKETLIQKFLGCNVIVSARYYNA